MNVQRMTTNHSCLREDRPTSASLRFYPLHVCGGSPVNCASDVGGSISESVEETK